MLCLSGPSAEAMDSSYSADFVRVILSLAARGRESPRVTLCVSPTGRGKGVDNPGLLHALYDLASRSRERLRCSEIFAAILYGRFYLLPGSVCNPKKKLVLGRRPWIPPANANSAY